MVKVVILILGVSSEGFVGSKECCTIRAQGMSQHAGGW